MSATGDNDSELSDDELQFREARESLVKCFSDEAGSRAMKDEHYKRLIAAMNRSMGRWNSALDDLCLGMYGKEKNKVKQTLSELGGKVCLSVDTQPSDKPSDDYFYDCIRVHFIDDDWKLRRWVIKYCCDVPRDDVKQVVLDALEEYGIKGKLLCLTVGDKLIADGVKEDKRVRKKLVLEGLYFRVQCCSDMINSMVQVAFKEIEGIIETVKDLSWKFSSPFWFYTSLNLSTAYNMYVSNEFSSEMYVLSKGEWQKVRSVSRITGRIYGITAGLFKTRRPKANHFLPHIQEIQTYLRQELDSSSDTFMRLLIRKMLNIFDHYWNDMYVVLSIAAVLDPRYKMEFVKACLGDSSLWATTVSMTIRKLYADYYYTYMSNRAKFLLKNLNVLRDNCQYPSDLDLYLEEPVLPWTEDFEVLQWWKSNGSKYPRLSRMARDFLAVPMDVATSYYDAYTMSRIVADSTDDQFRFTDQMVNALQCAKSWKDF